MNRCFGCGYMWADLDEEGRPITNEYCHYEGPDAWAPCEQDEYNEYANEARIEEEAAREEYEIWLMEQAIADEDYRSSVEYYGEPYDYQEF